jgi:regulatory protein
MRPDRRIPGNVVIELDGMRFATLPSDVVAGLDLETGGRLTEERFQRLRRVADVESAYRVALRMLAARPRAIQELLVRLRRRGHNPSAAAEAVGRLETRGLIDDSEFARHFARIRLSRGHGPPRILRDLLARGVERRLAERAIDEIADIEGFNVEVEARALAERRARQLGDLPANTLRRRLLSFLARRGYQGYEVRELVEEVVGEAGHAGDDFDSADLK